MFVETVTAPRELWQHWTDRLGLHSDPPAALVATVAWDIGDGMITSVNVWDTPSAVGDFFIERVQPVIEAEGQPDYKPARHGHAVAAYFRGQPRPTQRRDLPAATREPGCTRADSGSCSQPESTGEDVAAA